LCTVELGVVRIKDGRRWMDKMAIRRMIKMRELEEVWE